MSFSSVLIQWYLNNKRSLPWRQINDPYLVWLSEIILQQTRVEQGLPYYERFSAAFPSVYELADASQEQVLKLWQGLGYYSRARNMHASAKFIVSELSGEFPDNYKDLLQLKGVGDYTASAIASICFNEPVAVVDGNVYRVLSRVFGVDTPINSTEGKKQFKILASDLLDQKRASDFNQGLMEFGALQCKPQNPHCKSCPFSEDCVAFNQGRIKDLPVKLKKQPVKTRHFNYLVFISKDQKTLLHQRRGKGIWEGLYEFPLVETASDAKKNSLIEQPDFLNYSLRVTWDIQLFNELPIIHKLSHQHLHTKFWIINCESLPREGVPLKTLGDFPVPTLIDKFIDSFGF